MLPKKIGVIGAGMSGLVTAKILKEAGLDVTVLERDDTVGGPTWSRSYLGLGTQTVSQWYRYTDHAYPEEWTDYATGPQMHEYFTSYADKFGVTPLIQFGTEVLSMTRPEAGKAGWIVKTRTKSGEKDLTFDFVVIASGLLREPRMPTHTGQETFKGTVMHSSEYRKLSDGQLVIVGCGKSAIDIATTVARTESPDPVMIFKDMQWFLTECIGPISHRWVINTRFWEWMVPVWTNPHLTQSWGSQAHTLLHKVAKPFFRGFWKMMGNKARSKTWVDNKHQLEPTAKFEEYLAKGTGKAPDGFWNFVREGRIKIVRGSITKFDQTGVQVDNGQHVAADTLVYATGFHKTHFPFIPETIRQSMDLDGAGLILYRWVLHPSLPDAAFIGASSGYSHMVLAEVAAIWLAALLTGRMPKPANATMEADIKARPTRALNERILFRSIELMDLYCYDMGVNYRRKPHFWNEPFSAYSPLDYVTLKQEMLARPVIAQK